MHLLNKKSSPSDGKREGLSRGRYFGFSDLLGYGSAVFFLLIVFNFFQFLPFNKFHNLVINTSSNVRVGLATINGAINLKLLEDVSLEIKRVPEELFIGIKHGIILSFDNFIFSQNAVKKIVVASFNEASQAILYNLDLANEKIIQTGIMLSSNLDMRLVEKPVQVSTAVMTRPEPIIATSSGIIVDEIPTINFTTWFNRFVKSGLLPIIATSYEKVISPFRTTLNSGISMVFETRRSIVYDVTLAWADFFNRLSGKSEDISDVVLREQLKKEILQELQNGSTATVRDGDSTSMYTDGGIVLLKQTGSTVVDLNNVKKIQDSFSDRVLVDFDNQGGTGVIQPIFRDRVGEKYIFVITPVKK